MWQSHCSAQHSERQTCRVGNNDLWPESPYNTSQHGALLAPSLYMLQSVRDVKALRGPTDNHQQPLASPAGLPPSCSRHPAGSSSHLRPLPQPSQTLPGAPPSESAGLAPLQAGTLQSPYMNLSRDGLAGDLQLIPLQAGRQPPPQRLLTSSGMGLVACWQPVPLQAGLHAPMEMSGAWSLTSQHTDGQTKKVAMALPADCWHDFQPTCSRSAGGMVQLLRAGSGGMQRAPGL